MSSTVQKMTLVAQTDSTFRLEGTRWTGKCLICNGPMAFDARTGEGASIEHIRARGRGGTDDLHNLGLVHTTCNHEKGRRWDPRRKRTPEEYEALVSRMLARRQERW